LETTVDTPSTDDDILIDYSMEQELQERYDKIEFTPFLREFEKTKIMSKYDEAPFDELFKDLKDKNNDALLYIMNKYEPLIESLYTAYWRSQPNAVQFIGLPPDDWKNEVFMYLSGAGNSPVFYDKFKSKTGVDNEQDLWTSFNYYMKNYLMAYLRKLTRAHSNKNALSTSQSLNSPLKTGSEDSSDLLSTIAAPEREEKPDDVLTDYTDNDTLIKIFNKFLGLLKDYSERYKTKGRMMYLVTSLKAKGKSSKEIIALTGLKMSGVLKSLYRSKLKWVAYLNAHKDGAAPRKLEHTESNVNKLRG
jgi:hypothetical protein